MKAWLLLAAIFSSGMAHAQASFAVATIRPSAAQVRFESDGETILLPASIKMRDVSIQTCIKWAYGVQRAQVLGPGLLTSEKYDIEAKADGPATEDQMKAMMQALLAERFGLAFHREKKELRSFALEVAKGGPKLGEKFKQATSDEVPWRANSAMGTTARALTMQEFADFLSGPTEKPVVDKTGLAGRWDFSFDFSKYMLDPPKGLDDFLLVLNTTLQGEMGLKLESEKDVVEVMVVDKVQKASAN
ncbi:soil-associated protein, TIGR03435 family [Bryocella elongata]|uniref:Soil-associated protein, TIGR03435 family n=1 Tax=Bryocella elongata TaxID=863522 RepID=A0A1H5WSK2_9BACT|nr:TIGR03435 family protein [Bryocella elongata]SEG02411.1 soil-associated protein, TIGR03435 family [Bryocella elongata]